MNFNALLVHEVSEGYNHVSDAEMMACWSFAGVLREVTTHFLVDARAHHKSGGSRVKAAISNPSGINTDAYVTDKGDGTYRVEYTPYEDGEAPTDVGINSCSPSFAAVDFPLIKM